MSIHEPDRFVGGGPSLLSQFEVIFIISCVIDEYLRT